MVVRPRLDGDAAKTWWQKRVSMPETDKKPAAAVAAAAAAVHPSVTVVGKRMTNPGFGVPEIMDDGRDTGVMDAIEVPSGEHTPVTPIQDDGKQTVAMDAVDLKALGLSTPSSEMPAVKVEGEDDDSNGNGDKPSDSKPGGRRKRKKR
jgi:hypothetical protein